MVQFRPRLQTGQQEYVLQFPPRIDLNLLASHICPCALPCPGIFPPYTSISRKFPIAWFPTFRKLESAVVISWGNNKITITVVVAFHFSTITLLIAKPQSHIFETPQRTEPPCQPNRLPHPRPPILLSTKAELMTITTTLADTAYLPSHTILTRPNISLLPAVCVFGKRFCLLCGIR